MRWVLEVGSWDRNSRTMHCRYASQSTSDNEFTERETAYGDVDQGASRWITGLEALTATRSTGRWPGVDEGT
jgi:hypothetical protein